MFPMRLISTLFLFALSLNILANPFKVSDHTHGLSSDRINAIIAENDFLWVATDGGVNCLTLEGEEIKEVKSRHTTRPVVAIVNEAEFLYVGIKGKGLYKLYKGTMVLAGIHPSIFSTENVISIEKNNDGIIIITESKKAFEFLPSDSSLVELTEHLPVDSIGLPEHSLRMIKGLKNKDNVYVRGNELFVGRTKIEQHPFDLSKPITSYKMGNFLFLSNNGHLCKYYLDHKVLLEYTQGYNLAPFAGIKFKGITFLGSDKGLLSYLEQRDTLQFTAPTAAKDTVPVVKADTAKLDTMAYQAQEKPSEPFFNFDFKGFDFSSLNWILAGLGVLGYSILLIWLTSFKYKKDIKTLEDELLRKMKSNKSE